MTPARWVTAWTAGAEETKLDLRAAAAKKVTAARLGEGVMNECMHIFGGSGYLVDETPLGRWWRDMKLARVGGGTDEVLWELVVAAMKPDYDGNAEFNQLPSVRRTYGCCTHRPSKRQQVAAPTCGRPVVLPRLREVRSVHPLRDEFRVVVRLGDTPVVRLAQDGRRRCSDGAYLRGDRR